MKIKHKTYSTLISMGLLSAFAQASVTFSTGSAADVAGQSAANVPFATQTFNTLNDSANFLIAVAGDNTDSFGVGGVGAENNNPLGLTGLNATLTLSSFNGTGSILVENRPNNTTGSFNVSTSGVVNSFTLTLEYLDSANNPLSFAGRLFTSANNANNNFGNGNTFGPIAHVVGVTGGDDFTLGLGALDSNFAVIDNGVDHVELVGANNGTNADITLGAGDNGGITEFTVGFGGDNNTANIGRFGTTPLNNQDDFFSGAVLEFTSIDTDGFDSGSTFNLSFDGSVIGSVPEPSSTSLLGLGALGLLCRRSRKA